MESKENKEQIEEKFRRSFRACLKWQKRKRW